MPHGARRSRRWRRGFTLAWIAIGWGAAALAQDAAPSPSPGIEAVPAAPSAREEALEERLRKMEEMNQKLFQQFQSMAQQNETLAKTVQDLSKKLDATTKGLQQGQATGAPGRAAGADTGGKTGGSSPAGGSPSTPASGGSVAKADQTKVPLKPFADQSYKQRYGFALESEDKEFELRVNGMVQLDARIYEQQDQSPVISDFNIPRARLYFGGRVTKPIEYQISFQRSTNNFDLLNAYINLHYDDRLQIRAGRFRVPYTYEWAKLSNWELLTPDRAPFPLNFGPNRMVGLMGFGSLFEKRVEYYVGIFNGPRNSYQDFNYAKDVASFLDFKPFLLWEESPLKNLSVGGSVLAGRQNNPPVPAQLRGSTPASQNFLNSGQGDSLIAVPFLVFNNNVRERGDRALWALHSTYFYKGLSVLAEWESGHNDFALRRVGAPAVDLPVSGYHVQAGYLLTGETREKLDQVEPLHPFNLSHEKFGLGALELQARYSEIHVDRKVFTSGLADPDLWTDQAQFVDLGFNWYLNKYLRFTFDWQHGVFGDPVLYAPGPALQKTSDLFWMRLQVYF